VEGLAKPSDVLITKRQWGAFHGTELDLQLRRRGVATMVLAGITTNMGVESTARQAWEHGYSVVIAADATSANSAEMHNFALKFIFSRISRVVESADLSLG
jgi:nicotinamidase-related amidase